MNAKLKKLWVEALVSGAYPQTHETLKDDNGYCCLGVLCAVALKNDLVPAGFIVSEAEDSIVVKIDNDGDEATGDLNDPEQWGITMENSRHLIDHNDGNYDWHGDGDERLASWDFATAALYVENMIAVDE